MKDVFTNSNYIDKFESVFRENAPENILSGVHSVHLEIDMQSEYLKDQAGTAGHFWYDKRFQRGSSFVMDHFFLSLRIGINPSGMFFDMLSASKLYSGYHKTFSIRPTQVVTDEHLRQDLSPSERNCRFHDEMPDNMTLFKNYSMAACQFECLLSIRLFLFC